MNDDASLDSGAVSRYSTMAVAIAFELGADQETLADIKFRAELAGQSQAHSNEGGLWQRIEPVVSAWNTIWRQCVESGEDDFVRAKAEIPRICSDKEVVEAFLKVQSLVQPLAD